MLIIRKLNLISVQSWTYLPRFTLKGFRTERHFIAINKVIIKEKLEMAFASPLGLKVGEGGSRGTLLWLRP